MGPSAHNRKQMQNRSGQRATLIRFDTFSPSPRRDPQPLPTSPSQDAQETTGTEEAALPRVTVLLVSDDQYFRTTMRAYLEHVGFRVRCGGDFKRAPELLLRGVGVDLLLIDAHSTGAAGLGLAADLSTSAPDLPVIVICAPNTGTREVPRMSLRGWRFVSMPVALPELLGLIRNLLESSSPSLRSTTARALPREAVAGDGRFCTSGENSDCEAERARQELKGQGLIR